MNTPDTVKDRYVNMKKYKKSIIIKNYDIHFVIRGW